MKTLTKHINRPAHRSGSVHAFQKNWIFIAHKELDCLIYWTFDDFNESMDYHTLRVDNRKVRAGKGPIGVTATRDGYIRVYIIDNDNKLMEYCLNENNDRKWFVGELATKRNFKAIDDSVLCPIGNRSGNPLNLIYNAKSSDQFDVAYLEDSGWSTRKLDWEVPINCRCASRKHGCEANAGAGT